MKKLAALLALALAATALVACGDDDEGTTTTSTTGNGPAKEAGGGGGGAGGGQDGGAKSLSFETPSGAELAFTTDEATTKAGKVTVSFDNVQAVPHDVAIEDSGGKTLGQTETITDSSTSTVINLKPGNYTFYCSVPGHREAGMEGTLTVE